MKYKKIFLFFVLLPLNVVALTKAPIDITKYDINGISKLLDEGIINSETLVNLYLDRIAEYEDYNAIITINDEAINEAKKLDQERASGKVRSVIHGIPIIVKDNIDVLGMPTTAGTKSLKDNYPKNDAEVIKRLKEAGAIILAKSNMSEFAFQASSSRSSYGTVKNAYNKSYSSYGSSGGSAVSVALNLAPAALGTDTNSSIRVPASASSLVGYRPTFGNVSSDGVLPYDPNRDTVGLLTKSADDSIILTNIITDVKITNQLTDLKGINIGVPSKFLKGSDKNNLLENKETYNEIYNLMVSAINKMKDNGANIIYIDEYYTYTEDYEVTNSYSGFLFCDSFNKYIKNTTGTIRSFEGLYNSSNKITDLKDYYRNCQTTKTMDEKNQLKNKYKTYLEKIYKDNNLDVIVYPTTKNKLLKQGTTGIINTSAHAASTVGFPAISMPLGFDSDKLPYGIEFMALNNEDNKLFNIVSIYEDINIIDYPTIAPSLYTIDEEVTKLLNNYLGNQKILFKKSWNKKVKTYLTNYNDSEDVINEAKILNKEYQKRLLLKRLIRVVFILTIILYLKNRISRKRNRRRKINVRIHNNR